MDSFSTVDAPRDEAAAKLKFESFRLGKGLPSSLAAQRNSIPSRPNSLSASPSLSFSTTSSDSSSSLASSTNSKRNSHHRRRSSVSTRHESAEIMGVTLPDLPPSSSDDNINLGEKDSIRRRALLALEGKPDMAFSKVQIPEFSAPDLEKKLFDFSMKQSLSQCPPNNGFSSGLMASGKRDSFKMLAASSSSKDQLHTLVEEEEEEEEPQEPFQEHTPPPDSPPEIPASMPAVAVTKPSPARPRPATLSLRPLSLTPSSLVSLSNGLPTPSATPGPRPGLKSLSLASSILPLPTDESSAPSTNATRRHSLILTPSPTPPLSRRVSPSFSDSPSPMYSSPEEDVKVKRRSSIGYKSSSSSGGLPTPELTPISDRRYSSASASSLDDDNFPSSMRPLSTTEQHFLFKSHNALLTRITDLERALSSRSRGRSRTDSSNSLSSASEPRGHSPSMSVTSSNEPSDEMLQLIADLKAERDELKRDVGGWRTRVGDLEKQLGVFAKRVDNERREAWVARSRVGLLEVEKNAMEKSLSDKSSQLDEAIQECDQLRNEISELRAEADTLREDCERWRLKAMQAGSFELECSRLRSELDKERQRREEVERELEKADLLATPTPRSFEAGIAVKPMLSRKRGLGFTSVDSTSSATDVESLNEGYSLPLKAVAEEDEYNMEEDDEDYDDDDEDNGLAGYEDEEEGDASFESPGSSSSFGSEDEFPRSIAHLRPADVPSSPRTFYSSSSSNSNSGSCTPTPLSRSVSPERSAAPTPGHAPRASLSKVWTFPRGVQVVNTVEVVDEADRFFGCLEDSDNTSPLGEAYAYEQRKGLFAKAAQDADDSFPPFVLPSDVGVVVGGPVLDAVSEEAEDDDDDESDEEEMFGPAGGITITFTPPEEEDDAQSDCSGATLSYESDPLDTPPEPESLLKSATPNAMFIEDEDEDEDEVPFNFGRPRVSVSPSPPPPSAPASQPCTPRKSSIPRAVSPLSNAEVSSSQRVVSPPTPSSLPRPIIALAAIHNTSAPRPSFMTNEVADVSTPPRASPFVTPPNKRGGIMPSLIPQSVSSPSPIRPKATTTFIRAPQRAMTKPALASNADVLGTSQSNQFTPEPVVVPVAEPTQHEQPTCASTAQVVKHDNDDDAYENHDQHGGLSLSSFMPAPLAAARFSFSTLTTTFNPFSWGAAAIRQEDLVARDVSQNHDVETVGVAKEQRGFVTREQQLQKLRSVLGRERQTVIGGRR
ncbi:hypothetical protein HGRIS_009847 [Hohenbuehelia grisea]|uniref:Uncharacterized protein n=1 Tax=Hohenbuehelia grisea TaxID=104357 RepID=A0ABR3J2M3_9AGAR